MPFLIQFYKKIMMRFKGKLKIKIYQYRMSGLNIINLKKRKEFIFVKIIWIIEVIKCQDEI